MSAICIVEIHNKYLLLLVDFSRHSQDTTLLLTLNTCYNNRALFCGGFSPAKSSTRSAQLGGLKLTNYKFQRTAGGKAFRFTHHYHFLNWRTEAAGRPLNEEPTTWWSWPMKKWATCKIQVLFLTRVDYTTTDRFFFIDIAGHSLTASFFSLYYLSSTTTRITKKKEERVPVLLSLALTWSLGWRSLW